jgi:hypothetical protein
VLGVVVGEWAEYGVVIVLSWLSTVVVSELRCEWCCVVMSELLSERGLC